MSVYYYEPFFSFNDLSRFFDDAPNNRSSTNQQLTRNGDSGGERTMMMARGFMPKIHPRRPRAESRHSHSGRLVVSGEQMMSKDMEEKGFMHRERQMGRFSRTLPLPGGTKLSEVQAKMENGLLMVMFPKNSQEQQPQKVAIQ